MVYFDSWDEFAAAVEQLCVAEPKRVSNILSEFLQFRFITSRAFMVSVQFADVYLCCFFFSFVLLLSIVIVMESSCLKELMIKS